MLSEWFVETSQNGKHGPIGWYDILSVILFQFLVVCFLLFTTQHYAMFQCWLVNVGNLVLLAMFLRRRMEAVKHWNEFCEELRSFLVILLLDPCWWISHWTVYWRRVLKHEISGNFFWISIKQAFISLQMTQNIKNSEEITPICNKNRQKSFLQPKYVWKKQKTSLQILYDDQTVNFSP